MNWGYKNWGRKRIRGLRRHYRNLRQRAQRPGDMRGGVLTWLARYQATYFNVIADPWACCKEVPRQPAFRAFWVAHFVRTLHHWHAQVQKEYPAFYLAIWLYAPTAEDFCHSRIQVAVKERRLRYENVFVEAQEVPLPLEYLAVPGIETVDWQAYAQLVSYTPEDFEQAGPKVTNKPCKQGKTGQGEPCILVQFGWVWVGQARNEA